MVLGQTGELRKTGEVTGETGKLGVTGEAGEVIVGQVD